jgi:hypothetical protein
LNNINIEKALLINEMIEKEVDERGSDYTSEAESSDDEKKWDC